MDDDLLLRENVAEISTVYTVDRRCWKIQSLEDERIEDLTANDSERRGARARTALSPQTLIRRLDWGAKVHRMKHRIHTSQTRNGSLIDRRTIGWAFDRFEQAAGRDVGRMVGRMGSLRMRMRAMAMVDGLEEVGWMAGQEALYAHLSFWDRPDRLFLSSRLTKRRSFAIRLTSSPSKTLESDNTFLSSLNCGRSGGHAHGDGIWKGGDKRRDPFWRSGDMKFFVHLRHPAAFLIPTSLVWIHLSTSPPRRRLAKSAAGLPVWIWPAPRVDYYSRSPALPQHEGPTLRSLSSPHSVVTLKSTSTRPYSGSQAKAPSHRSLQLRHLSRLGHGSRSVMRGIRRDWWARSFYDGKRRVVDGSRKGVGLGGGCTDGWMDGWMDE
ncbi:hypothetical protein SCHPADRAFT_892466 [Schizopora paradoxa]|uniref:Uncharacterized protein n=1 Tax=Schizopora paradoxa TaxID=27342 RepID=A0A0H2REG9_9AGAM|nr:hypothetical protein SCHPADRAFT_892466 [Schizopora paradoxa]